MSAREPVFFLMHIMKTGGTSLLQHVVENFPAGSLEPDYWSLPPGTAPQSHYGSIHRLLDLDPERRAQVRFYTGHHPYWVTEIIEPDITISVLRDPVDRTISLLRQAARVRPGPDKPSIEELYENPRTQLMIRNYQAKLFAMSRAEWEFISAMAQAIRPDAPMPGDLAHLMQLDIDQVRLARAKENLARVDVIGLQSNFDELLATLRDRFGWTIKAGHRLRVAPEHDDVPQAFRRRVAEDNVADMELWSHAVELVEQRRRAGVT